MSVTAKQLRNILPGIKDSTVTQYLQPLNQALEHFDITTPLRAAAFIAQTAHESMGFTLMRELWGPTKDQLGYEPPSAKARRLGNTQAGDGKKYKGRGAIQLTGKSNYKKYGDKLGIDLVNNPELAQSPKYAFEIAGLFWKDHGLNELADHGQFEKITRLINGGVNGLIERYAYYERAKDVLLGGTGDI